MSRLHLTAFIVLFYMSLGISQSINLTGRVVDEFGEPLPGALIKDANTGKIYAITDEFGHFILLSRRDEKLGLVTSQFGLHSDTLSLAVDRDTFIIIKLKMIKLKEVIVKADAISPLARPGMSSLPLAIIQKLPTVGGEVDIIKALSYLPGVTNGREGASGLYVRGGSPDQNLILLDDAVVYNPTHLFGFVSAFHPLSISKVDLYKGGFPARFGGRISSVLDIKMREGNKTKRKGEFQIGLINSSLHFDGPIKKRSSYMASGRIAYLDLLFLPQRLAYKAGGGSDLFGYRMYDLNLKYHTELTKKHNLSVGFYTSQDQMRTGFRNQSYASDFSLGWSNRTLSARLVSSIKPRLMQIFSGVYSDFQSTITGQSSSSSDSLESKAKYTYGSAIRNITLKYRLDHHLTRHILFRYGLETSAFAFTPNRIELEIDGQSQLGSEQRVKAIEAALFMEQEFSLLEYLKLHTGLRLSNFFSEKRQYRVLEPRANLALSLGSEWYLFTGLHAGNQNIHLLTNSGVGLQTDVWVPSNNKIKPQYGRQVSFGASKIFRTSQIEVKSEIYYKSLSQLIEYKEGASVFSQINSNQSWDAIIDTSGQGYSKGFELAITKQTGSLNMLIAYTWSRTERKFESINGGSSYPFTYDFTHYFQSALTLQLSKGWSISNVIAYRTGQPISLPTARIHYPPGGIRPNGSIGVLTSRNASRLPDYFRIDFGANFHKVNKRGRDVTWAFSLYNSMNRKNALYAQVAFNGDYNSQTKQYDYNPELSVRSFLPILPSASYRVTF
jgi:hypothetical protein